MRDDREAMRDGERRSEAVRALRGGGVKVCLLSEEIGDEPLRENLGDDTEEELIKDLCSNYDNSTRGKRFRTNLNLIFPSLISNGSRDYGFFNASSGINVPDAAYGLVQCRGDLSKEVCEGCLKFAAKNISSRCPEGRRAFIRYENCILRYSDEPFFSRVDTNQTRLLPSPNFASDGYLLRRQVESLMSRLTSEAASNASKFAIGSISYTDPKPIYGMVQCTRDLSEKDCLSCIQEMIKGVYYACRGKEGCRVTCPSCVVRYEVDAFSDRFILTPIPPPASWSSSNVNATSGKDDKSWMKAALIAVPLVEGVLLLFAFSVAYSMLRRKINKGHNISGIIGDDIERAAEFLHFDFGLIKSATGNFSTSNKLGQGGFGSVYKGQLSNGQEIAVKRLSTNSRQGSEEFKNEVMLLHKLQHRNLVKLLGFCLKGKEELLIYEYVTNGSLDKYLFDPTKKSDSDWETRYKIIRGIARGILYLHEDSRLRIIHRDLKASNILLDDEMNPRISDFGMARLFGVDQTHDETKRVAGTLGYMAPEYVVRGIFSAKSDVYSFGVLLLEIISGEKNINVNQSGYTEDLLSKVWQHWREGTALEFLDQSLSSDASIEVIKCIHIGLLCIQKNIEDRPTMASVVLMLDSNSGTLPNPSPPPFVLGSESAMSELEFGRSTINEAQTHISLS
ncbi:hypothetical protein Syun_010232 [Stephania yunnanensis]|uniref:Uncharacterized protein n=1 Tax=Stephania yunnanensis TaxID=152371 RepID=A0AAP0KHQ5_9MAGN